MDSVEIKGWKSGFKYIVFTFKMSCDKFIMKDQHSSSSRGFSLISYNLPFLILLRKQKSFYKYCINYVHKKI